jgi:micrococcal nuclease
MAKRLFSANLGFWVMVLGLFGLSGFFAVSVEMERSSWAAKNVTITSGAKARVLRVIDGDEVSVQGESGAFVVRLLGIKAFRTTVNEPGISAVGVTAMDALQRYLKGKEISIQFKVFKKDRSGRVLAYLDVQGRDVGLEMVKQGFVLVFNRYTFERQKDYFAAELEAKTRSRGLWANRKAVVRATALKATWDAQRGDD